jgi:hypothetical protein
MPGLEVEGLVDPGPHEIGKIADVRVSLALIEGARAPIRLGDEEREMSRAAIARDAFEPRQDRRARAT